MAMCPAPLFGKYRLKSFNGKSALEGELAGVSLELSERDGHVSLHTRVGNVMNGMLKYDEGKLIGGLMSTRMMPPPALMEVETALSQGFSKGMLASREGAELILSHENNTIVYEVKE